MKELSIEEKAKRYDKLFVKASRIYNKENDVLILHTIEDLFPKLKESEDERIKEALIEYFRWNVQQILSDFDNKEVLAWLEKQGEPIDKIVKRAMNEKQRVLLTETNGDANIDWDTRSLQDVKLLLEYGLDYIKKLEKQGEQKPTDTVEPKFHEGDFIKHNKANIICKVISVNSGSYYVENIETSGRIELFNARQNFHLWTIQDAKDGDVLTNGDFPCIFKRCDGNGSLYVYCGINAHNDFSILSEDSENIWDDYSKQYFPATKEQRDTLFTKMKESGYEWLEETKELKKIEQKSADWSEEDEKIFVNLISYGSLKYTGEQVIEWLNSLKQRIGG